jgi:hypothetical protein
MDTYEYGLLALCTATGPTYWAVVRQVDSIEVIEYVDLLAVLNSLGAQGWKMTEGRFVEQKPDWCQEALRQRFVDPSGGYTHREMRRKNQAS